jgi:hypothetical protein
VVVVLMVVVACALLLPRVLRGVFLTLMELDASPRHAVLMFCVVMVMVNPLAVGYGVVVFTTGMIFGWWGFIIAYTASSTQHNTQHNNNIDITHTALYTHLTKPCCS